MTTSTENVFIFNTHSIQKNLDSLKYLWNIHTWNLYFQRHQQSQHFKKSVNCFRKYLCTRLEWIWQKTRLKSGFFIDFRHISSHRLAILLRSVRACEAEASMANDRNVQSTKVFCYVFLSWPHKPDSLNNQTDGRNLRQFSSSMNGHWFEWRGWFSSIQKVIFSLTAIIDTKWELHGIKQNEQLLVN